MDTIINATDARKEFSRVIDTVVKGRPQAIKRNRDIVFTVAERQMFDLLKGVSFTMECDREEDGTVSGSLEEVDLVANAPDPESLRQELAKDLIEYAHRYLDEVELYYNAPNRRPHFPLVLRVLLAKDVNEVVDLIAKP